MLGDDVQRHHAAGEVGVEDPSRLPGIALRPPLVAEIAEREHHPAQRGREARLQRRRVLVHLEHVHAMHRRADAVTHAQIRRHGFELGRVAARECHIEAARRELARDRARDRRRAAEHEDGRH